VKKFGDWYWVGILVGIVTCCVIVLVLWFGINLGEGITRREIGRTEGRYIEIQLDGFEYSGWLKKK
jgi:hypothetical protein